MSYISVIGEERRVRGGFSHLRTYSGRRGGGGEKKEQLSALNLTRTHDRSVRMLLLSGSPGEEQSNDLVRVRNEASFRGGGTLKRPYTRRGRV